MSLPIYQHYNLRSASLDDLSSLLSPDLNMKHPVVMNLKLLDAEQQREIIGLIENYYVSHNISYKFPYPIYLVTDHEPSITKMPTVKGNEFLPKFFTQKESKMNVKEAHLVGKNRLVQQEIKNSDSLATQNSVNQYGSFHKKIFELENERIFYRSILNKLTKEKK